MAKPVKHWLLYAIAMCLALTALAAIMQFGGSIDTQSSIAAQTNFVDSIQSEFIKNVDSPLTGLILQIFVILVFSRICAAALKALGQAQVIGEMIAGILLGKSVLAYLWPLGFAALFPESSMPRLYFLSQIGLIFFMFVVGLDLKISELKNKTSAAVMISHVSIVFPFLLGALVALGIYDHYGPQNFTFSSFALFMGIAVSITAFPVLARIIQEKQLTQTPLGTMALTCAAIDDVTAWCLLAAVVGIVKAGSMAVAGGVLLSVLIYVAFMIKIVRPLSAKILRPVMLDGKFAHGQLAIVFCLVLGSAALTEIIGIHALFGAFMAGAVMPQSFSLRSSLIEKIEDLSAVVLLPIFFAYTGLRMQIGLLNTVDAWLVCALIIFVAITGKLLGSALAARWSGMSWRDSWALGSLMNTRGLMELVVLNIGYDIGIISPTIFAMMVTMAIVTTIMTGPLLSFILQKEKGSEMSALPSKN